MLRFHRKTLRQLSKLIGICRDSTKDLLPAIIADSSFLPYSVRKNEHRRLHLPPHLCCTQVFSGQHPRLPQHSIWARSTRACRPSRGLDVFVEEESLPPPLETFVDCGERVCGGDQSGRQEPQASRKSRELAVLLEAEVPWALPDEPGHLQDSIQSGKEEQTIFVSTMRFSWWYPICLTYHVSIYQLSNWDYFSTPILTWKPELYHVLLKTHSHQLNSSCVFSSLFIDAHMVTCSIPYKIFIRPVRNWTDIYQKV